MEQSNARYIHLDTVFSIQDHLGKLRPQLPTLALFGLAPVELRRDSPIYHA